MTDITGKYYRNKLNDEVIRVEKETEPDRFKVYTVEALTGGLIKHGYFYINKPSIDRSFTEIPGYNTRLWRVLNGD